MKKIIPLLIAAALVLACTGCGVRTDGAAAVPEGTAAESADSEENAAALPSPDTEEADAKEPLPEDGEAFLCTIAGMNCLYAIPLNGGDAVLLDDGYCHAFSHRDNTVVAGFEDGEIRQYDLATGEKKTLLQTGFPVFRIELSDSGFLYEYSYDWDTLCYYYSFDGRDPYLLTPGSLNISCVAGDSLIYLETTYPPADHPEDPTRTELVSFDMQSRTELWRRETGSNRLDKFGDDVYLQYSVYDPGAYRIEKVDLQTGASEPVNTDFLPYGLTVFNIGSGGFYAEASYKEGYRPYFVSGSTVTDLSDMLPQCGSYLISIPDRCGDLLLMRLYNGVRCTVFEENDCLQEQYTYFLLDLSDGSMTVPGVRFGNAELFAGGDFPVLDSSTARKPVTTAIYKYFCLDTGHEGAMPVCNTTHGAWLAIADGTSDAALLAAPTGEELDYLSEKNVEVEMKLYGGDGLVFIGGTECGVTDLSPEDIRDIYSGRITNWAQLGGADHPIRVLYRDGQSGSERLFESFLWKDTDKPDYDALGFECLSEMTTIVNECLSDPYTIGYSIMTYLNDVYGNEELQIYTINGVAAEPANVADGSYLFGTRGYVVIRSSEPAGSPARRLYDWFGSPVSDRILILNGITPLSEK